jgi:hypothetical protein
LRIIPTYGVYQALYGVLPSQKKAYSAELPVLKFVLRQPSSIDSAV